MLEFSHNRGMKSLTFSSVLVFVISLSAPFAEGGRLKSFEKNLKSPPKSEVEAPPSRGDGSSTDSSDDCGFFCVLVRILDLFGTNESDDYSSPSLYKGVDSAGSGNLYASSNENYLSADQIAGEETYDSQFEISTGLKGGEGALSGMDLDFDAKLAAFYIKANFNYLTEREDTLSINSYGVGFNFDLGAKLNMGFLIGLQTSEGQFYQQGFLAGFSLDLKLKPWMWFVLDYQNSQYENNSINEFKVGMRFYPSKNVFIEPYVQRQSLEYTSDSLNFAGLSLGLSF